MIEQVDDAGDFGTSYWRIDAALSTIIEPRETPEVGDTAFRLLADNIPTLCWIARGDGYIFWYNRRWHDYCGTTPAQMEGWGWQSVHDPAMLDAVMARWTSSIATGEPFEMTFPLRGADGTFRPFLTRIQPLRDASGEIVRWFGVNTDVSAQYLVEDKLRVVQGRGQAVLASMNEGFALLDREFRILDINDEGLRLDRRGRDEIVGRLHWDVWPGSDGEAVGQLYKRVAATGITETLEIDYEWPHSGRAWVEVRAFPHPEGIAVFYRDIGDRKRAEGELRASEARLRDLNATLEDRVEQRTEELLRSEEALRQAQKMEAVGQLTGGIAHDFNNMLAVVMGSLDLLSRRMTAEDARARRYIEAATEGARRAANLTQRLLAFSRQQPLKPEPIDVNRLVTGMSDLLLHSLGGAVQLETVLAGGLWPINADPNQLENVILNLAINGRDAMPDGGKMTVETQNAHLDSRYAAEEIGVAPGQYVMIALTDSGSGMPQDVIDKAFDPFFTTKEVGKGTGLGLSQVYGFVKQSGGHVRIYSEVGQGSTVKLYLPRLLGHKMASQLNDADVDLPLGDRNELILVVEDEPAVRQFSTDALGELGYRVLEADSGKAALLMLDEHPDIALMFTDIVMPEMNGAKLAEVVRAKRPDLPILFTTGYTRNAVVHNGVLDPGVELIGKPFTIEELAARVRTILDSKVG